MLNQTVIVNSLESDLTSVEVRKELNISNVMFWKLLNLGELDAYRVGNKIRVKKESLLAYKARNEFVPNSGYLKNSKLSMQG